MNIRRQTHVSIHASVDAIQGQQMSDDLPTFFFLSSNSRCSHSTTLSQRGAETLTVRHSHSAKNDDDETLPKKIYTVRVLQQKTGNALKACALKNWNTLFTLTVKLIKVQNCALEKWKTLYTLTVPIFLNPKFDLFVNNHFQIKSLIVF